MKRSGESDFSVHFNFHESLRFFLPRTAGRSLGKILREKTSIKDAIESCGIPHPEVDLILTDDESQSHTCYLNRALPATFALLFWQ